MIRRELPMRPAMVAPADDLNQLAQKINNRERKAGKDLLEHAKQQGVDLINAKKQCKHGQWQDWITNHVAGISLITATRYMRIARNWDTIKESGPLFVDQALKLIQEVEEREENQSESVPEEHFNGTNGDLLQSQYVTLERWEALTDKQKEQLLNAKGDAKFNFQGWNDCIEWALWSWNPITGCLHECPYCYARDIAERLYEQKFAPSLWPGRLKAPQNTVFPQQKINEALQGGSRQGRVRATGLKNVFVCSMADLFGRWVPTEWIEAILGEVRRSPHWNYLFLTKFPIRLSEFDFPDNAWVGTTVDCQARVKNAEKAFSRVRAKVKWLSCEPLIEPLKFDDLSMFNWVIIGGASASRETPVWEPPSKWVVDLDSAARKAGCQVYHKENLGRVQEYPGIDDDREAPEEFRYLARVEK